jgi:hypothetical protein
VALGAGKRPPVKVTINGYEYRSTVAVYSNTYYLPLRREIREAAKVDFGDIVPVAIELDEEPRVVEAPADLAGALEAAPDSGAQFDRLSYSHRKEYVDWIESAKREETRRNRVATAVEMLREGKKLKR